MSESEQARETRDMGVRVRKQNREQVRVRNGEREQEWEREIVAWLGGTSHVNTCFSWIYCIKMYHLTKERMQPFCTHPALGFGHHVIASSLRGLQEQRLLCPPPSQGLVTAGESDGQPKAYSVHLLEQDDQLHL